MLIIYDKSVSFDRSDTNMFFDSLGYGVLTDLVSDPLITEELNGSYILEFEYKKDGKLSEYLVEENIIKAHGEPFSIYSIDKKINNRISVLARHWVLNEWDKDFLIDVAPTKLSAYNALKWIQERSVNKSNINISGNCENISSARYVNKTMLESIFKEDNAILTKFGGELSYSKNNVFINNRRGSLSGLTIRQGKNISGAEYYLDFTTVTTRLVPVGKDGLMLPNKFVDSPLINNYATPIVRKIEVDTDNITELENYCNKLYESGLDKPTISVKIDFVELSKTTEYKKYSSLETAHLGDTVVAYIPSLGLNFSTRIVKTVYNDNLKRITSIELGTIMPNIAINNVKIQNSISQIANSKSSILDKAKQDASSLIKHPFEGYLYIDDSTGTLYIMDTNDISTAKNIWRWGLGGLGFSSTGIDGTYGIAITQDGKIVADYILTGTLSADRIEGYNELLLNVSSINTQIIPTSTVSGPNIHIEDASDKKMVNFELEGKSEQATRSGKNLFNIDLVEKGKFYDENSSLVNYNNSFGKKEEINGNEKYGLYIKNNYSNNVRMYAFIFDENNNRIRSLVWGETLNSNNHFSINFTCLANAKYIAISILDIPQANIKDIDIQLEKGRFTIYEPYGVMPSPDFPSEIESVGYENLWDEQWELGLYSISDGSKADSTTNIRSKNYIPCFPNKNYYLKANVGNRVCFYDINKNFISIEFDKQNTVFKTPSNCYYMTFNLGSAYGTTYKNDVAIFKGNKERNYIPYGKYEIKVKNTGKNLFNKLMSNYTSIYNTITINSVSDNSITLILSSTGGPYDAVRYYSVANLVVGQTYTVSANIIGNDNSLIRLVKNNSGGAADILGYVKKDKPFTFTYDGSYNSLGLFLYVSHGVSPTEDLTATFSNIQIEKGPTATEYEPYQENKSLFVLDKPLRSLPNGVKDIAYIKNNMLYVDRYVGSMVLNGSESWGAATALHDGYMRFSYNAPAIKGQNRAMSNYFKIGNTSSTSVENLLEYRDTNVIFINTNVATNLNGFKTWLSTHNTQVDYELAEPYTEKIGEVEIPSTFKGVNNITTTDELEPVMNIEYVRDTILSDYVEGQVNSSQAILRNEMNAKFVLQQENIDLELSKKVNDNEIIASINMSTEKMEDGSSMQIQADKLNLKGKKFNLTTDEITIESENFSVSKDGKISAKSGEIGGFEIETDKFSNSISETYNFTENDYTKVKNYIMGTEDLTDEEIELYDINGDGKVSSSDYVKIKNMVDGLITNIINGTLEINSKSSKRTIVLRDSEGKIVTSLGLNGSTTPSFSCDEFYIGSEKQPSIQSGTSLPTEVKNGVVFLLYDE